MTISKTKTNFIVDLLMFLFLAAMTGIGLMMKYVLIPGQDRWLIYGRNVELYVFNLDRHQWGTVHLIVSLTMLALLALHIILHWKAVIAQFKSWFSGKNLRTVLTILFVIICFILVFIPTRINPEIEDFEGGRGRFYQDRNNLEEQVPIEKNTNRTLQSLREEAEELAETGESEVITTESGIPVDDQASDTHEEHDTSIDVQGFMTLKEVAERYQVPADHIKSKLDIPQSISVNEKLGRLRRTYSFTMSDVRDIIIEFKEREKL